MLSERSQEIIRKSPGFLKRPVRLVLFFTDRGCPSCPEVLELGTFIKSYLDNIALEMYDKEMDRDKSEQYGITQAPALVIQDMDGKTVVFYGLTEDVFLEVLMHTIRVFSEPTVWFPDAVRRTVKHLVNTVRIRVFVESDCAQCRPVAETAIGLAMENGLINTEIIIASDFPKLIRELRITTLPLTIFGDNLRMEGHVTESAFLEMIFQSEGLKSDPDRRCLVCGNAAPDIICASCKTRIQAEAIDHKTRLEKGLQSS